MDPTAFITSVASCSRAGLVSATALKCAQVNSCTCATIVCTNVEVGPCMITNARSHADVCKVHSKCTCIQTHVRTHALIPNIHNNCHSKRFSKLGVLAGSQPCLPWFYSSQHFSNLRKSCKSGRGTMRKNRCPCLQSCICLVPRLAQW